MAKDSDASFDAGEIEKLLGKAKTSGEAYSFAFGLASSPDDCGFMVHLRKPGSTLRTELKKSSRAIKKVCFGTFTVDGGVVKLAAEKPVKGIVKQLKKRFRDAGITRYKPTLVGPDGAEIDEDLLSDDDQEYLDESAPQEVEEAADPVPEAPPVPPAQPVPDMAALKARLVAIRPQLDAAPKAQVAPLIAAFTKAVGQAQGGDAAGAGATLDVIERALARSQTAPEAPAQDAAAKLTTALNAAVARIRAMPAGAGQRTLALLARDVQAMIASGDMAGAVAALKTMATDLTGAEAEPAEAPIDIWNGAKEQVDAGITKLQAALRGFRHPVTDRIAEFGLAGFSGGGTQTAIMTSLMGYNSAAAPDRPVAARSVVAAVAGYRTFLESNRIVALCESNPLGVAISIRAIFGPALDRIERAVAVS